MIAYVCDGLKECRKGGFVSRCISDSCYKTTDIKHARDVSKISREERREILSSYPGWKEKQLDDGSGKVVFYKEI